MSDYISIKASFYCNPFYAIPISNQIITTSSSENKSPLFLDDSLGGRGGFLINLLDRFD